MNDLIVSGKAVDLQTLKVGQVICTLDPKNIANRKSMAMALQSRIPSIMEAVNLEIEVSDILLHPIEVDGDEIGEIKRLNRVVVFARDGKLWSFCGYKALKDLLLPAIVFGLELPYKPAQRFAVKREKVREGEAYYVSLEWIGEGKK